MSIGQIDMQSVQPHDKLTVIPRLVVMMHQIITVKDSYASHHNSVLYLKTYPGILYEP